MLHSQQADLFLAWIVSGIAFHQDTGMLFFPNELFTSEMKYRFCGQFIKKNTSSMWAVFRPTGNLYVEIIYGCRETPHKKDDYTVSICNLCAFFF